MGSSDIAIWGEDLTLLCGCDHRYLPGAVGLFNSALMNGFKGRFSIMLEQSADEGALPRHGQLEIVRYRANKEIFAPAAKLGGIATLAAGKYLLLDADMIIERPCGDVVGTIDDGLLVSTERDPKYDPYDVIVYHQCMRMGMPYNLPPYPYINAGLFGFQLPRDERIVKAYAELTHKHLVGVHEVMSHQCFKFPEQDILNILVRRHIGEGKFVFSVSPKRLELGWDEFGYFRDRPFPSNKQRDLQPEDQVKYLIHGAALRRPWLSGKSAPWRACLERNGVLAARRRLSGKISPYERAWAYYACSKSLPIRVADWATSHGFVGYEMPLWRWAYGLCD